MKKTTEPNGWREGRRLRAWELSEQGWKQKDIAAALGVTEGAVSQWLKKAREGGKEALRHQRPPGARPKLTRERLAEVPGLLDRGAEAFGFRGNVWTGARVAKMIEKQFGVRYDPSHCSRLLRQLKYSPQKPVERATQRKEEEIVTWKTERWEAIKKKPKPSSGR